MIQPAGVERPSILDGRAPVVMSWDDWLVLHEAARSNELLAAFATDVALAFSHRRRQGALDAIADRVAHELKTTP